MAEAIPRAQWSEAEEYAQRFVYWEYLVNSWLVPGPAILKEHHDELPLGEPRAPSGQVLIFLSNLRTVPRARLSC